jgi:hypothetical protein
MGPPRPRVDASRRLVIRGLFDQLAGRVLWLLALPAGLVPRRLWDRLDPPLPLWRTAFLSALLSMSAGFYLGLDGLLKFGARTADANNAWMLRQLANPASGVNPAAAPLVPYGFSLFTLFVFLFLTPLGLFCVYLFMSGGLRAVSAWFDEPHGDLALSGLHWAATTMFEKNRQERRQIARERVEGADAPDVLQTGAWAGVPDADYVVLAARRKAEWNAGAIILTSSDWYKLGVSFEIQTPAGLRTAYPLKKMDTVEVVRRGIQYELPRLSRRPAQKPQNTPS